MRRSSQSLLRTVHQCPECGKLQRHYYSRLAAPQKSVFPRIISTETGNLAEDPIPVEQKQRRGQTKKHEDPKNWQSSGSKLYNSLRQRAGLARPKVLYDAIKASRSNKGFVLQNRMREWEVETTRKQINPEDLLQEKPFQETDESIFDAISSCISAAIDQLGLYGPTPKAGQKMAVPHDQYMWLCRILEYQFLKEQLVQYGAKLGLPKVNLPQLSHAEVIEYILSDLWNLEKEADLPSDETLITKRIPITPRQRFFMVGEGISA